MSSGLRQPERRIQAKRLQFNRNWPSPPGEINLRISSSCTFMRNRVLPNSICKHGNQSLGLLLGEVIVYMFLKV
ncbi:unnamed protein product [Protopolystoma xenopodis]|uniref:Uncharacterized protein n=1 Tax=Protopolystoma xenopodis TaxID=117903 RepID=A0A3S5CTS0_9PLAT|nr:unnamed protein product [Protopolystoma xenopodis]